jgi:hypothetical protein
MATHNYNMIKHYPGRILKCINSKVIEISPDQSEQITSSFTPGIITDDIDNVEDESNADSA